MYQILRQNKETVKYFTIFTLVILIFLLVTVVYKNDYGVLTIEKDAFSQKKELAQIKEFLFKKIKSPFINVNYEIKSGDNIQKILKKFNIKNDEIQKIIEQYKKHGSAKQVLKGNKIDLLIKENFPKKIIL